MHPCLRDLRLRCRLQIQGYIRGELTKLTDAFLEDTMSRFGVRSRRTNQLFNVSRWPRMIDVCGGCYIQVLTTDTAFMVSVVSKPAGITELVTPLTTRIHLYVPL